MKSKEVFVVSAVRTPIGKFGGALKEISAVELGSFVIQEAVKRTGNPRLVGAVEEVIMGQVLQAGSGQAPARQAQLRDGLPNQCAAMTVRKECASSLLAVDLACSRIKAGDRDVVVAGGMESMTNSVYLLRRQFVEGEKSFGHGTAGSHWLGKEYVDSMLWDGLQDAYEEGYPHMGELAERISEEYRVSRQMQDEFAFSSFRRAQEASKRGDFRQEIVRVALDKRKESIVTDTDEGIRETSLQKLSQLKPVFKNGKTITAGNSSQLSDGAAALLLMGKESVRKLKIQPMAKILGCATFSMAPAEYPVAPVGAIKKVLEKCGLSLANIDFFEINEAFAPVPLIAMRELDIPHEKLNVRGGAIALGHPLGASGARILTTLLYILQDHKARYGIASACNGGGEAVAVLVENLSFSSA